MAFRGTTTLTLDSKNRLTVPVRYREELGSSVVLARDEAGGVGIWNAGAFDRHVDAKAGRFPEGSTQRDHVEVWWSANSHDTELDSVGRVMVPNHLVDHAALTGKVVLIGSSNRLVAWEPDRWKSYMDQLASEQPDLQNAIDHPA